MIAHSNVQTTVFAFDSAAIHCPSFLNFPSCPASFVDAVTCTPFLVVYFAAFGFVVLCVEVITLPKVLVYYARAKNRTRPHDSVSSR